MSLCSNVLKCLPWALEASTEYHSHLVKFWWRWLACLPTFFTFKPVGPPGLQAKNTHQKHASLLFETRSTLLGVSNQVKPIYTSRKAFWFLTSCISFDQGKIYNCFTLVGTREESSYILSSLSQFLVVVRKVRQGWLPHTSFLPLWFFLVWLFRYCYSFLSMTIL